MGKQILISDKLELSRYAQTIYGNLQKSLESIKSVLDNDDPACVFESFKYDKIAIDPLTGSLENLIEMVNQYQTYLVTLKALEFLFEKHSNKSFIARFGNVAGYDIESTDGEIVAECFAQVSYKNNKKLDKDLEKLSSITCETIRYEFFYDRAFNTDNYIAYKTKYPEINIIKFETLK